MDNILIKKSVREKIHRQELMASSGVIEFLDENIDVILTYVIKTAADKARSQGMKTIMVRHLRETFDDAISAHGLLADVATILRSSLEAVENVNQRSLLGEYRRHLEEGQYQDHV